MSAGHDAATASPTSDGRPVVRRALESRSGAVLAVASVVFALVVGLRATGVLQELELGLYDQYVRQFDAHSSASRVVVVGVTEDDIRALGHWPLTDTELAAALERLAELGPRAVGIDIYRDIEVRDTGGGSGQPALRAVFRKYPFLIAPMRFGDGPPFAVPPPPFLSGFDQVGFVDVVIDDDGKVRRGLLYLDDGETSYESMSLKLALLELQAEEIAPAPDPSHPEYLRLGRSTFRPFRSDDGGYSGADDRGYQYLLDFGAGGTPYKVFPLATLTGGRVPRAEVEGKVALIGVTAGSVPDTFYVASSRVGENATALRGLMLHARLVDQLMSAALDGRRPLRPIAGWQEVGLILAVSLLGGGAGLWTRSPWRFLGVVLLGTAALVIGGYALFAARLWLPVAAPALAWAASAAGVTAYTVGLERRQRGLLMRLFRSHVSPEVADAIWQQRRAVHGRGTGAAATGRRDRPVQRPARLHHPLRGDGTGGSPRLVEPVHGGDGSRGDAPPRRGRQVHRRRGHGRFRRSYRTAERGGDRWRRGQRGGVRPRDGASPDGDERGLAGAGVAERRHADRCVHRSSGGGQPRSDGSYELHGPRRYGEHRVAVGKPARSVGGCRSDGDELPHPDRRRDARVRRTAVRDARGGCNVPEG